MNCINRAKGKQICVHRKCEVLKKKVILCLADNALAFLRLTEDSFRLITALYKIQKIRTNLSITNRRTLGLVEC